MTMQEFLADAAQKAASDLMTAFLRLPEDKRDWSPDEKARTALSQVAECANANVYTVDTITQRAMLPEHMTNYLADRAAVMALPLDELKAHLTENVQKVAAVIRAVPDAALDESVKMPRGDMTVAQVLAYPQWNMSYHEGQINYIASILGCLD